MEKKETKRYSIVEYLGVTRREYCSLDEYRKTLDIIEKNNRKKTTKYYFGNVTCEKDSNGKYIVLVHVYNRLTPKMTISEIDNFTQSFDEEGLIEYLKNQTKTKEGFKPDINICYFENKNSVDEKPGDIHYERRIKYIPILYQEDKKYLDKNFIKNCLVSHAKSLDYDFFKALANEFCIYRVVIENIEDLFEIVDKCRFQGYDPMYMAEYAYRLFNNLIVERDSEGRIMRLSNGDYQISRRRLRDFGFFIRDYNMPDSKRVLPTRYNKSQIQSNEMKLKKTNKEQ